jgi:hypothetical protein
LIRASVPPGGAVQNRSPLLVTGFISNIAESPTVDLVGSVRLLDLLLGKRPVGCPLDLDQDPRREATLHPWPNMGTSGQFSWTIASRPRHEGGVRERRKCVA